MKNFYPRLVIASILVLIVYLVLFFYVDRPLALAAEPLTHTFLYPISKFFFYLAKPSTWAIISLVGFIICLLLRLKKRHSRTLFSFTFIFASNILASILCKILKVVLARYRPIDFLTAHLYGFHFFSTQYNLNSTPSGHAAIAFSIAMSLSILFRRYRIWFFLVACLVAISRIIMEQHFLSDVLFGAYVGIISALIIRHHFLNKLK